jgi:hypothetical protein
VTLCIAAECEYLGKPAIAMCSDWRSQTGNPNTPELMTGVDDLSKTREYGRATVMLAGPYSMAFQLATVCKTAIRDFATTEVARADIDLAVDAFMRQLEQVAASRKMDLVRTFIENTTGLTQREFIALPKDEHSDIWREIRYLNLEADLLIAVVLHEAVIVKLDRFGKAHWVDTYGIIGNGSEVARAMLCLQTWEPAKHHSGDAHIRSVIPLEECLFRISEAHLAAHKANPSSVGSFRSFQVLTPNYRSTPTDKFLDTINAMWFKKHRVPEITRMDAKDLLHIFQSLKTSTIEEEVPTDL